MTHEKIHHLDSLTGSSLRQELVIDNCAHCRFFQARKGTPIGWCHRFPPTLNIESAEVEGWGFPQVTDVDWCGEWQESKQGAK